MYDLDQNMWEAFYRRNHEVQYGTGKSGQFLAWFSGVVQTKRKNWWAFKLYYQNNKWKTKKGMNGGDRRLYECIECKWSDDAGKRRVKEVIY